MPTSTSSLKNMGQDPAASVQPSSDIMVQDRAKQQYSNDKDSPPCTKQFKHPPIILEFSKISDETDSPPCYSRNKQFKHPPITFETSKLSDVGNHTNMNGEKNSLLLKTSKNIIAPVREGYELKSTICIRDKTTSISKPSTTSKARKRKADESVDTYEDILQEKPRSKRHRHETSPGKSYN